MKNTIDFGWETDEDRLRRWVKFSPQKRLEWLYQAHESTKKILSPKQKERICKMRFEGVSF